MYKTLPNMIPALAVAFVLLFTSALTALAYEELEIEIETLKASTKVMVSYEIDEETVQAVYTYNTTDRSVVYEKIADQLDLTVAEVEDVVGDDETEEANDDSDDASEEIADAQAAIEKAETYIDGLAAGTKRDTYESWLVIAKDLLDDAEAAFADDEFEKAEDLAKQAENKAKHIYEGGTMSDDKDKGHGNNTLHCDDDNPGKAKFCAESPREKLGDRFKNFGTSTDREELQAQLRELMTLFIQLLQQARGNF